MLCGDLCLQGNSTILIRPLLSSLLNRFLLFSVFLVRRHMQSSDPCIYAAGDSASCQWAADESRHWFQMRLWSQVGRGVRLGGKVILNASCLGAGLPELATSLATGSKCGCGRCGHGKPAFLQICSLQVAVFDAGLGLAPAVVCTACAAHRYISRFPGLFVHTQARAMGIYAAHCMVGVEDQVGCCCRPAAPVVANRPLSTGCASGSLMLIEAVPKGEPRHTARRPML